MLVGKTAIITGSACAIGRAMALALAKERANVLIKGKTVVPYPKLEGTINTVDEQARALGSNVLAFCLDKRQRCD